MTEEASPAILGTSCPLSTTMIPVPDRFSGSVTFQSVSGPCVRNCQLYLGDNAGCALKGMASALVQLVGKLKPA